MLCQFSLFTNALNYNKLNFAFVRSFKNGAIFAGNVHQIM